MEKLWEFYKETIEQVWKTIGKIISNLTDKMLPIPETSYKITEEHWGETLDIGEDVTLIEPRLNTFIAYQIARYEFKSYGQRRLWEDIKDEFRE